MTYVDDLITVGRDPSSIMQDIQRTFKFKDCKVEVPTNYLGAKLAVKKMNRHTCWTVTSVDYVNATVANVEKAIQGTRWKLPSRPTTPMTSSYIPELDGTPELGKRDTQFFQELIGMLRWATVIGRVDVLHETSILSQYQAGPREGHLEQALHIFGYLKRKPKLTIYLNPSTIAMPRRNCRLGCQCPAVAPLRSRRMLMHHMVQTRKHEGHIPGTLYLSIEHRSSGTARGSRLLSPVRFRRSSLQ